MSGASNIIKKVIGSIPWRKLTLAEARELALRGEHLAEREGTQLVGAPRGVGRKELPALRARLDEAAREGRSGAGWYDAARGANREMSAGSPQTARELAAGQAIYSNQATPEVALGWTLAQRNASALEGVEPAAKRNYHYGRQAKQYASVLKGEDPEAALGQKTSPYFRQMNPEDASAQAIGVNDQWMGRLYGYKRGAGGFSESEHGFMTGENLLARARADEAGTFPEGTSEGVAPWQAAAWTGQRLRMLRSRSPGLSDEELLRKARADVPEAMEKFTAYETAEQIPSRGSEHLAGAVDLPLEQKAALTRELRPSAPGQPDPYYQALGMAQRPPAEGLGQFTESVTPPEPTRFLPAFMRLKDKRIFVTKGFHNPDELPGVGGRGGYQPRNWTEGFVDQKGKFYNRNEAATAIYEQGEKPQAAPMSSEFLGEARLTSENLARPVAPVQKTDYNPNITNRPMVSYKGGREGERAPDIAAPEKEMLRGVNVLRSAVDVQAAGALHGVKAVSAPRLQNAARVVFPEPQPSEFTAILYERVQQAGLNLIDTGKGSFTVTGDFGQMAAGKFKKLFAPLAEELEKNGARIRLGKYVGMYHELPTYGQGRVTEHVLEQVMPRVGAKLNTPELKAMYLSKNRAEESAVEKYGLGAPRADVQKLRRILAKHGGVEGLRRYVAKYGTAGLPAIALTTLNREGGSK